MKIKDHTLQIFRTIFQGIIALGVVVFVLGEIPSPNIKPEALIYSLSMMLQIGAAVLLLLSTLDKGKNRALMTVLRKLPFFKLDEEQGQAFAGILLSGASARALYINRIAFLYLGIGFFLSVFGSGVGVNTWGTALWILAGALLLTGIGSFAAEKCVKHAVVLQKTGEEPETVEEIEEDY